MRPPGRIFKAVPLPRTLFVMFVLAGLLALPASATAGSSLLCQGYDSCSSKGKSHYGYKEKRWTSYWTQATGNNCTNYAAFRFVTRKYDRMSNTKPWSGSGNALTWGTYNASRTNSTPRVGAVAWWSGTAGLGRYGHVAYVERVISSSEIWISDSSWGGSDGGSGFTWKKLTKSGSGWAWPSGFIHFKDERLINTAAPKITGTPKVGIKLTASRGSWTSSSGVMRGSPVSYKYQWLANGSAISGATASTFTPTAAYVGKRISVKITASSPGYPAAAKTSALTAAVAKGSFTNTVAPTVSGTPEVGVTLSAKTGSWSPTPSDYRYQWRADGTAIDGATSVTYTPTAADEGKRLSVTVTAVKTGYNDGAKTSAATAPVAPGGIVYAPDPSTVSE
jgi:surface antigen